MRSLSSFLAVAIALGTIGPAFAADPGSVVHLKTEAGSVLVQRGAELYELKEGDAVFEGDRIFTRTYGAVGIKINGCNVSLGGQQSITITPQICTTLPTTLNPDTVIAGIKIGVAGGSEIVGGTPALLGLLAAGGGIAAAASQNSDSQPASP